MSTEQILNGVNQRLIRILELYKELQILNPNDDYTQAMKDIENRLNQ